MKCFFIRTQLSILLLLGFLFFPLFIGGDANAEGVWEFDNSIDTMVSYRDGIMLLEGSQLWFWNPDQPELQRVGDEQTSFHFGIHALFTGDDGQLLALGGSSENAKILRCLINGQVLSMTEVCTLKLPDAENNFVYNAFYQQNMIFVVLLNRHTGQETLYAYDIASQQEWVWENCPVQHIALYQDKLLLGTQRDAGMKNNLVSLDIVTRQTSIVTALPGPVEMLAYSKSKDEIAYLRRPIVYMGPLSGTKTEQGYLPVVSYYPDKGILTGNDYFALADGKRLLWTKMDPTFSTTSGKFLTIADYESESNATRLFRLDNPGVPVISRDVSLMPADIAQVIRSNDTDTDIYVVRTAYPGYSSLLSKGYCTDLSSDSNLTALASNIPEPLLKGLMYDGKIVAFPVDISFGNMAFSYSPEALAAMGMTEEVMPGNLTDFLSLLIEWYESGKMDEVRLFDYDEPDYLLAHFLLRYYTEYYEVSQEEPLCYQGNRI